MFKVTLMVFSMEVHLVSHLVLHQIKDLTRTEKTSREKALKTLKKVIYYSIIYGLLRNSDHKAFLLKMFQD